MTQPRTNGTNNVRDEAIKHSLRLASDWIVVTNNSCPDQDATAYAANIANNFVNIAHALANNEALYTHDLFQLSPLNEDVKKYPDYDTIQAIGNSYGNE